MNDDDNSADSNGTDDDHATIDLGDPAAIDGTDAVSTPSTHKVLGSLTDASGVGVLGRNDAGSGTPVGVRGEATGGYGLETPDDARIEGALEATSGHELTVDGVAALSIGPLTTDYYGRGAAGNVVVGYYQNDASDYSGVTIPGGGAGGTTSLEFGTRPNSNLGYGDYATVGGGRTNRADRAATVGGGRENTARATASTIGGGTRNVADGVESTVGGGKSNEAWAEEATIGGGIENVATGTEATIAGGQENFVERTNATVGGGYRNEAFGQFSTVGGGAVNAAGASGSNVGLYATVPGGHDNAAAGNYAFAAGEGARADHDGSYVWSDATSGTVTSTTGNTYLLQATNGVGINTTTPESPLDVAGGNWDLDSTEGDLRVGSDDHRLKVGVATGGGGAGIATVRAESTHYNKLNLGAGTDDVVSIETDRDGITIDAVYPATDDTFDLGYPGQRWTAVYAVDGTINTSDARLKTGVRDLEDGLERIQALRPIRFEWADRDAGEESSATASVDPDDAGSDVVEPTDDSDVDPEGPSDDPHPHPDPDPDEPADDSCPDPDPEEPLAEGSRSTDRESRLGLIAQEVADVVPEAVVHPDDEDGYFGLRYSSLVPVLVDAVQTQQAQIDTLERENSAIREELAAVRSRVDGIELTGTGPTGDD